MGFLDSTYMEVSIRGWCCLQMFCTWPVTQLQAPASSCHTGRGAFVIAFPLPLRGGTALLCWKDPAAWEPSRDTHEYKVLWSLSSSEEEAENSPSLVSCNTA